jgi:MFS family permease
MTLAMAIAMIASAPVAGRLIARLGTRLTMAAGLSSIALGFAAIALTWRPGASVVWVLIGYALLGCGVGIAGDRRTVGDRREEPEYLAKLE